MFNKSVKVKSNNQVKASERKNIKAKVHSCFPDISEVDLNILLPNKPINVLKVLTHNSVDVIVYAVEKRVVFFEIEKVLYPSIYTLWKHPDILLSFTTHVPVLSKLMQGADLMIPGVVLPENIEGPAAWGKFEKDQIVSINLTNNKASIAVGKTCHSSMDMYMAAGRGRCIEIIHVLGDELCSLLAPAIPTPDLGAPGLKCENTDVQNIILDNINLSTDNPTENNIENIALVEASTSEQCESKHMSSADVDALLRYTFLKCLNTEGKKLTLPMLTSTFYGTHIMPACPKGSSLDIKKSSYKKVSKFLIAMSEEGFLKLGELKKGVESVTELAIDHDDVRTFTLDENDMPTISTDSQNSNASVENLLRVTKPVLPLISSCGIGVGQTITRAEIRKAVTDYVKQNSLQNTFDPRVVILNQMLQDVCGTSAEALEWPRLLEKIESRMTPIFEMKSGSQTIQCKGKAPIVVLTVSKRAGNKKVTLVDNLELFGINLLEFSKDCQLGVATSTSINKSSDKKGDQVLIQGNQVAFIGKLLTDKYKIPKKYIRGLELAVKKK